MSFDRDTLIEQLFNTKNSERRESALGVLGATKNGSVAETLIRSLSNGEDDDDSRSDAALELGEIDNEYVVEALLYAMGDKSKSVQLAAIRALGTIRNEEAQDALRLLLGEGDKDRELLDAAADAIAWD